MCWTLVLLGLRAAAPWVPTSRSAHDLAVAVRELVPGPIDEVVVVNDVNRFGLAFALGCDVEHVALATTDLEPHVGYRRRLLAAEVGLPHGRRVHLVPAHSLDRYRKEAARLGVGFSQLGRIGKMFVFAGEPGARRG